MRMTVKANPYGADISSVVPRPVVVGGRGRRRVPPAVRVARMLPWEKPIPIPTRDMWKLLGSYLNRNEPKVARILFSTWNAQAEAIKYQEIRNAIRDGVFPERMLDMWREDYSKLVVNTLEPEWEKAMAAAGEVLGKDISQHALRPFRFTPTGARVREWIENRGGELAVALSDSQHRAMQAILRHYTVDIPTGPFELGRILRPVIGLTPKQAGAVQKFRDALVAEGLDKKLVEHRVQDYAGFLHRYRAKVIARTELAFAYNYGQLEAVRQAQEQQFFAGPVVKVWMTAPDDRVCDFCKPLDGQMIHLEETFPGLTPALPNIYVPPAHPQCRCTAAYQVLQPGEMLPQQRVVPRADPRADMIEVEEPFEPPYVAAKIDNVDGFEETRKAFDVGKLHPGSVKDPAGDQVLYSMLDEQGFTGPAHVVTKSQLDEFIADGEIEFMRGLAPALGRSAKGFAEDFMHGKLFAGRGLHGGGTYVTAAPGKEVMRNLATFYARANGVIVRGTIKKGSKIVDMDTIFGMMEADPLLAGTAETVQAVTAKFKGKLSGELLETAVRNEVAYAKLVLGDPGRYAASKGFDAIRLVDHDFYVILNRTAVRVQADVLNVATNVWETVGRPSMRLVSKPVVRMVEHQRVVAKIDSYEGLKETRAAFDEGRIGPHSASDGDDVLYVMSEEQGFTGLPDVISKEKLDDFVAKGEIEFMRGVSSDPRRNSETAFAEDFMRGELFAGRGIFGNGTYTAGAQGRGGPAGMMGLAMDYAGGNGVVMRGTIKKGSRIVSTEALDEMLTKEKLVGKELTRSLTVKLRAKGLTGESLKEAVDHERKFIELLVEDPGRYAVSKGIDVIHVTGHDYYIILNRTAVRVQEEVYRRSTGKWTKVTR